MAKFMIECPHCGTANEASTSIFAKKSLKCGDCGKEIHVKRDRMTSRTCPHCKKDFVYDQAKDVKTCPICHSKLGDTVLSVACPECYCKIQVDENAVGRMDCPVCDHTIEHIEKEIAKTKLVTNAGLNIIKYEGDNDTFVWKHPIEDFNLGTQLIVHETQEAYFFASGKMHEPFGPGRHTLKTANIPFLRELETLPTGKQTAFHAEVYFVNKTVQMSIPWGTPDRVHFIDPDTGAPIDIGASGEMNVQVSDAKKLLTKLVGTTSGISWGRPNAASDAPFVHSLRMYFKPLIATIVRSNLAQIIKRDAIDILEIDERLDVLSNSLREKLAEGFEEYGLTIPQFYVTNIAMPDESDKNFQIIKKFHTEKLQLRNIEFEKKMRLAAQEADIEAKREALAYDEIEAQRKRIAAQADIEILRAQGLTEAEIMKAKGYNEKDLINADVQKAYAQALGEMGQGGVINGGASGGIVNDMVGLGVGMAALGVVGDKIGTAMQGFNQPTSDAATQEPVADGWDCACGAKGITGKFCSECGAAKPEAWDCACGAKGNKGKFCSECGAAKPEAWDCACGTKGNKGKFCPECGAKKPE